MRNICNLRLLQNPEIARQALNLFRSYSRPSNAARDPRYRKENHSLLIEEMFH